MTKLPFDASPGAVEFIQERLSGSESVPDLVPGLFLWLDASSTDRDGRVTERIEGEHFEIWWYDPRTVATDHFDEIELSGIRFFAEKDTLTALAGKQLVVQTEQVGFPDPADKTLRVLRAKVHS